MVMESAGAAPVPRERPVPEPGPHEVLVRVEASCLNYHDLVNLMGLIQGPWPRVPMSDGAGEVVAVGGEVAGFRVGDRVFGAFYPLWQDGPLRRGSQRVVAGDTGDGWLRRHVVFPADALIAVPDHLSTLEAATIPCAATTAWSALEAAGIGAGDVVVAQGTGGVSLFAVQLAKARGATVVLTSSQDDKLAIGRGLGADHLVNYRTTPAWEKAVREITGGTGADLVVDVGGPATLAASVAACRHDGTVAVIGILGGVAAAAIPVTTVMTRQIHVQGVAVGSVSAHRAMADALAEHKIHPHISHTFDWTDLAEARRVQEANEHVGKIALRIG